MLIAPTCTPAATALRFPLRGNWFVANGGRNAELNGHWGYRDQQYAVDLLALEANGASHSGTGARVEQYHAWNRPVHALADGTVIETLNTVRDNAIGETNRHDIDGNHVIVKHADGTFSLYDHLRCGSIAVGVGDAIRAGQMLGRIGNSGNTSEPHLHVQLQTTADLDQDAAVSIPMVFGDIVVNEAFVDRGELPGRVLVRRRPETP